MKCSDVAAAESRLHAPVGNVNQWTVIWAGRGTAVFRLPSRRQSSAVQNGLMGWRCVLVGVKGSFFCGGACKLNTRAVFCDACRHWHGWHRSLPGLGRAPKHHTLCMRLNASQWLQLVAPATKNAAIPCAITRIPELWSEGHCTRRYPAKATLPALSRPVTMHFAQARSLGPPTPQGLFPRLHAKGAEPCLRRGLLTPGRRAKAPIEEGKDLGASVSVGFRSRLPEWEGSGFEASRRLGLGFLESRSWAQ